MTTPTHWFSLKMSTTLSTVLVLPLTVYKFLQSHNIISWIPILTFKFTSLALRFSLLLFSPLFLLFFEITCHIQIIVSAHQVQDIRFFTLLFHLFTRFKNFLILCVKNPYVICRMNFPKGNTLRQILDSKKWFVWNSIWKFGSLYNMIF